MLSPPVPRALTVRPAPAPELAAHGTTGDIHAFLGPPQVSWVPFSTFFTPNPASASSLLQAAATSSLAFLLSSHASSTQQPEINPLNLEQSEQSSLKARPPSLITLGMKSKLTRPPLPYYGPVLTTLLTSAPDFVPHSLCPGLTGQTFHHVHSCSRAFACATLSTSLSRCQPRPGVSAPSMVGLSGSLL